MSSADAAQRLGISVLTLYDWLSQSDSGQFQIRGQQVTIEYYQGGRRGQGRIKISAGEIDRLLKLMKVMPRQNRTRRTPRPKQKPQHITVSLGRPDD
ncbi:MAG: DNA-binding protein [Pirellulaceae bacterium]